MVIASMSVLSVLVTEFVYIAQMNQTVAFDGLDQLKAHYLAKSGFKLSLLRLKAFQQVKSAIKSMGGGAGAAGVSKSVVDKVWSFPFFYPIPTDLPGLSLIQKESIEKFQKASKLEGNFAAVIESESSKYNLNSIHAAFVPSPSPAPAGQNTAANPPINGAPNPNPNPSASPTPFDPEQARASLREYLQGLYASKLESDQQFAEEYRDWRFDDFMESLFAFADPAYESKVQPPSDAMTAKRAPFYSLSELRMIPGMEDSIYDLFAPALTASMTPGINVNTLKEPTLRALIPTITAEEIEEFFKHRDSEEQDNTFKAADDFFKYVGGAVQTFVKDPGELNRFKTGLQKRNIRIIVDESEFKITVTARVNQSTRVIEAWVTLNEPKGRTPGTNANNPSAAAVPAPTQPDAGLRVTFMRIL
jgi:hypothetical protein